LNLKGRLTKKTEVLVAFQVISCWKYIRCKCVLLFVVIAEARLAAPTKLIKTITSITFYSREEIFAIKTYLKNKSIKSIKIKLKINLAPKV